MFRLIRTRDWREVQRDGNFQIVPTHEARAILENLASAPTASESEKAALQEAASMLPVRALSESRLLLVRHTPVRVMRAASSNEPAMTPSQIARKVREEQHWIEIQLLDDDGHGISGIDYLIVTPDDQKHSGVTGADGVARLENIPPGQCKVSFPRLDREIWRPA
jgi:hypothetical protein